MHPSFRFAVLVLAGSLIASHGRAQSAIVEPRTSIHPYLFFGPAQIAALKERIQREQPAAEAWSRVRASAEGMLTPGGRGATSLETLGFAYRMTGDQRFAAKIRDVLLRDCQRPNWGEPDLLGRDPSWHAGLGTARTLYEVSVGFDCAYDALSPEDRRTIAQGLINLGILPTLNDWLIGPHRIHTLDTMGHNWWSACVFMAGLGSLAVLDEEPRARGWLEDINRGSVAWFNYGGSLLENKPKTFDAGGALYESANYDNFAMSEYLLFRLAWTNALQAPEPPRLPVLDRAGDYFLSISYPNSGPLESLNFGDGSLSVNGSRVIGLLWALGDHRPRYLWYLQQVQEGQFREGQDRDSPFGLAYGPSAGELAAAPAAPDLPTSTLLAGMGWATLRSSWNRNATLLGIKSGYTWNHSHADAGSFILFHQGANLLIDSGNPNYARPEYDAYYRQSQAHNVVLFNGQAENPEDTYFGSKFSGSVSQLLDAGDLKYVMADATGPTSQLFIRNFRHFLWIGDVILVIDDLKTFQPGQFEWLLHVNGRAVKRGLDLQIGQSPASILVRPLFPESFPAGGGLPHDFPGSMRLEEKTGLKDHDPDAKVTYYALAPPEQTRRTKFITAIILSHPGDQAPPQIEKLRGNDFIGVRLRQGGTTTEVYLNLLADGSLRHQNANLTVNGWETDAYLTAITVTGGADPADPDAVSRYFVADGSYLRREGKVVLDSLSKVFLTAERKGTGLEVNLQGQPIADVALRAATKPSEVRLNGAAAEPAYDGAAQTITVSLRP